MLYRIWVLRLVQTWGEEAVLLIGEVVKFPRGAVEFVLRAKGGTQVAAAV